MDKTFPIKVFVEKGYPQKLANVEVEMDEEDLRIWNLLHPYRKALRNTWTSTSELLSLCDKLHEHKTNVPKIESVHLIETERWAKQLLIILEEYDRRIREKVLNYNEDILGAYFYERTPKIELYWGVIGLCCMCSGEYDVESLSIVVLVHELAHAYTHIGTDIDGGQWDTKDFHEVDVHVAEGLAQYYTEKVLFKIKDKYPKPLVAFEELLGDQPKPYRIHKEWVKYSPETIRRALLETRRQHKHELRDFVEFLDRAHKELGTPSHY